MIRSLSEHRACRAGLAALVLGTLLLGLGLALMRDARKDETLYLRETAIMADCLREGRWFGNEAVGVHGFLFKLPAALLFLGFGKSVYAATLVNVGLAALAVWLCFRLLRGVTGSSAWALAGACLLAGNFQFVRLMPTFTRDIPALAAVLLFLDGLLRRRNRWVMGMLLLLVLDAKEYLFFMLLPGYGLWILCDAWARRGDRPAGMLAGEVLARGIAAVLPAAVYAVLMLCTGVIPLNMFLAKILGCVDAPATNTAVSRFRTAVATTNLWTGTTINAIVPAGAKAAAQAEPGRMAACAAQLRPFLPYLGKLFYPSFFSFDGIPRPAALPGLVMSVVLFRRWRREGHGGRMALCLVLWAFLAVLLLMATYPRYMLPVFPILIACFLLFLRDGLDRPRFAAWTLLATIAYSLFSLYFEQTGLWKKIVVSDIMLIALAAAFVERHRRNRTADGGARARAAVYLFALLTLAVSLWHTWTHPLGQVRNWRLFGTNRECRRVIAAFGPRARFWVNDPGWKHLIDFYTGQRPPTPEWQDRLKPWVPKQALLRPGPDRRAYGFWFYDLVDLRRRIRAHEIDRVGLVISSVEGERFPYRGYLRRFREQLWLEPAGAVPLRNKTLYRFDYIEM
ncbi:MAG: hypothetical protein JW951_08950 [Lentisphaerae bacterium]|nr:hypothetical protein [Lentisphaerota bacterium]